MSLWSAEGLCPSIFWEQTPRTFAAVMKGRADARRGEVHRMVRLAHLIEGFHRTKDIDRVRDQMLRDPVKRISGTAVLARMRALQVDGAVSATRRLPQ